MLGLADQGAQRSLDLGRQGGLVLVVVDPGQGQQGHDGHQGHEQHDLAPQSLVEVGGGRVVLFAVAGVGHGGVVHAPSPKRG